MKRDVSRLTHQTFDLVIVGAGIYGVAAAWDAVLRGLKVALIDKGDFGSATSSNTQRMVHGGLRYLQNLDIPRMMESMRERSTLLKIAPHLVRPQPCLMPLYRGGSPKKWAMKAALWLNDFLSRDRNRDLWDPSQQIPRSQIISRSECLDLAPSLDPQGLTGGALWYDAQMQNSERLTLAFVLSAEREGAIAANYVEATGLLMRDQRIEGVKVRDTLTGESFEIRSRMVLNTCGPWIHQFLGFLNGRKKSSARTIRFAKAMNLVTLPLTNGPALALPSRSALRTGRRLFFIVPWREHSIVGTGFKAYDGNPDELSVSDSEIEELIAEINQAFPHATLSRRDVLWVHAGLLPVSSRFARPDWGQYDPHFQIWDHQTRDGIEGLISVIGVKYTTARDVAEKAVALALRKLRKPFRRSLSAERPVWGGEKVMRFEEYLEEQLRENAMGIGPFIIRQLISAYGSYYPEVMRQFSQYPRWNERVLGSAEILRGQITYSVREEMAQKLSDVIFRRTELGMRGYPGEGCLKYCAALIGAELGWGRERQEKEIEEVQWEFSRLGLNEDVKTNPFISVSEVAV